MYFELKSKQMKGNNNWIKKILDFNKWFVIPAILVLYISCAILMFFGLERLYFILVDFINGINSSGGNSYMFISASFIGIIDIYILAIVLYTLAVCIYKLFISKTGLSIAWIDVYNLNDLKSHLAKMSVLFLSTMLIQKIAEWKDSIETLYFAISISLICLILIFYTRHLDSRKDMVKEPANSNQTNETTVNDKTSK